MSLFFNLRFYIAALLCSSLYMPGNSFAESHDCIQSACEPYEECCETPCAPSCKRTALIAGTGLLIAGAAGAIAGVASSNRGERGHKGDRGDRGNRGPDGDPGTTCEVDTGESLTFTFQIKNSFPTDLGNSTIVAIPFIETPCGGLITGEPLTDWIPGNDFPQFAVIEINNPKFGIYHYGVQFIISDDIYTYGSFNIENWVASSRDSQQTTLLPHTVYVPEINLQTSDSFEYGPASSNIP